jgi:dephospho-CoA kinase
MLVLGVTGGVGTGKTTVSSVFADLGAEVIDADALAHELLRAGAQGAKIVGRLFGPEFIDSEGSVRRRALGSVVFSDPERRRKLEGALHPLIIREIRRRLGVLKARPDSGKLVVVLDAPVLLEAGARDLVDKLVVVSAKRSTQISRLVKDAGLSFEEAEARIASQMPLEEKIKAADFVVDNDGDLATTKAQVKKVWAWAVDVLASGEESSHTS